MAASTFAVLSGIASTVGAVQQLSESKKQATAAKATAELQAKETVRVSSEQARVEREEADRFARQQKLSYLKSGVSLEGSPFLALEETRLQGERNAQEIIASGGASSASTLTEGRQRASQIRASGRRAFISGITKAGSSFESAYNQ